MSSSEKLYYEVGEQFTWDGKTYEIISDAKDSCAGCVFRSGDRLSNPCSTMFCSSLFRKDGQNILVKEVETSPEVA